MQNTSSNGASENNWLLGKAGVDSNSGLATAMYCATTGNPGDPHWLSVGHRLLPCMLSLQTRPTDILIQYSLENE